MDKKEKLETATKELTRELVTSLTKAGKELGLGDEAEMIAVGTVLGSAKLVNESGVHPIELADRVCSPGGTTIEGMMSLKKDGFEGIITEKAENMVK